MKNTASIQQPQLSSLTLRFEEALATITYDSAKVHEARMAYNSGRAHELEDHQAEDHEAAVHKFLGALQNYRKQGVLSAEEYETVIGTAADVMRYFHLDLESLAAAEPEYRASVIHQMGQGMLQAIYVMHNHLTDDMPYLEAMEGLEIGKRAAAFFRNQPTRSSYQQRCHQWVNDTINRTFER